MAERTTVTQSVQIGKETVIGTSVAAGKRLPGIMMNTGLDGAFTEQRGSGGKFPVNWIPGKEWSRATISGQPSYDELTYLLASLVSFAAPSTVATTGRLWTFNMAQVAEDTVASYTVEQGSAVRAQKFSGAQVTELTLTGNRDTISVSGSMIGKGFTDSITLTVTPTDVPQIPILPKHVSIYADATSAGLGTTKELRALSWEWSLKNRFSPLWVVDAAQASYVTAIEVPVDSSLKIKFEADTQGMAFLTNARAGSKMFIRVEAVSDQFAGAATPYKFNVDTCAEVKAFPNEISDQDGIYAVEWEFGGVYDSTWAKAFMATLTNTLTAL